MSVLAPERNNPIDETETQADTVEEVGARNGGRRRLSVLLFAVAALFIVSCASDDLDEAADDAVAAAEDAGVDTDQAEDAANEAADAAEEAAEDAGVDTDEAMEDAEEAMDEAEDAAEDLEDGADTEEISEGSAQLAQVLRDNGLVTLATAVEQVDVSELIGDREFTFFAPNDEAFLALTADDTADLMADPAQLQAILENHLVEGRVDAAAVTGLDSVTTMGGNDLEVSVDGDTVMVGGATVVTADVDAGAGVVHVVDQVLLP